jgi:hypothetical protein
MTKTTKYSLFLLNRYSKSPIDRIFNYTVIYPKTRRFHIVDNFGLIKSNQYIEIYLRIFNVVFWIEIYRYDLIDRDENVETFRITFV